MLDRILEPEVMDTVSEAVDYNSMDHSAVNRVFVDDFLAALGVIRQTGQTPVDIVAPIVRRLDPAGLTPLSGKADTILQVFDAGTGTALIPLELMNRGVNARITASDLAEQMLIVAADNVRAAGQSENIRLVRSDCKRLADPSDSFDAVMSNSIVHHIPEPKLALAELWRILKPGGLLFVRDLMRPTDPETLDRLVATYAGSANRHQQQMFRESLHAALTVDEVCELLRQIGVPFEESPGGVAHQSRQTSSDRPAPLMRKVEFGRAQVRATSDRHWTITAYKTGS